MINANYKIVQSACYSTDYKDLELIAKQYGNNISARTVAYTFKNTKHFITGTLLRVINSIQKNGYIVMEQRLMVCKQGKDKDKTYTFANDMEKGIYEDAINNSLKEVGMTNLTDLIYQHPKVRADYNKLFNEHLKESDESIKYFYYVYDILATDISLEMGKANLSARKERESKKKLNDKINEGAKRALHTENANIKKKYEEKDEKVIGKSKNSAFKDEVISGKINNTTDKIIDNITKSNTRKKINVEE